MIEKIQEVFRDILDEDDLEITANSSPETIEDWDSIVQVDLLIALEGEFGVKFDLSDAKEITQVSDIIRIIESKQS
jgi:acyl carrier protein